MNEDRKDIVEVYYSSKCNICKKFLQTLYDKDLMMEVSHFHSYENIIFPIDITVVPTLKINGKYFPNEQAFKWIEYKTLGGNVSKRPVAKATIPNSVSKLQTLSDDTGGPPDYNFSSTSSLIPNIKEPKMRSLDDLINERKMN